MSTPGEKPFEITGRHVLIGTVGAFAVIIGVNLYMAAMAIGTFPGLEVKNSYVASQTFDAERRAQEALGWTAETRYADGALQVRLGKGDGPAAVASVNGLFGRTTSRVEDHDLVFREVSPGLWSADTPAGRGQWVLHLNAVAADGTPWRSRVSLSVR